DPRGVDTEDLQGWARFVDHDKRRGLLRERIRVFSEQLTTDQAMTLDVAWPILAPFQEQRVLRRGEHPVPDLVPLDYFIIRRHTGFIVVLAMHYDETGAFVGGELVDTERRRHLFMRDWQLSWAVAVPFEEYETGHPELHAHAAA